MPQLQQIQEICLGQEDVKNYRLCTDFSSRSRNCKVVIPRVMPTQFQEDVNTSFNTDINFLWDEKEQISGVFARVHLCVHKYSRKRGSKKCFKIGQFYDTVKDVEREVQLLKTLKHERIVSCYGMFHDEQFISIFMEYMEGGSIHDRLSREGPFPEFDVAKCCYQTLEALSYLHSKNIIHCDIKGANILLDNSQNCKLAGFELAEQIQTNKAGCKSLRGTIYWMSPEVIRGNEYGTKADIWSFGCTALEMLTTKPPWSQYEPVEALFKVATEPTCPDFPSDVSMQCQQFIEECLKRDPSTRLSAKQLLDYPFVHRRSYPR